MSLQLWERTKRSETVLSYFKVHFLKGNSQKTAKYVKSAVFKETNEQVNCNLKGQQENCTYKCAYKYHLILLF